MNDIDNKKIKDLMHKLGLKYQLPDSVIKELLESPYEFTASIIKELKLDDMNNVKELDSIKTNFMYTGFAKLFINPLALEKRIEKHKNNFNLNK